MRFFLVLLCAISFILGTAGQSTALLISGQDIIFAPQYSTDDPPGAENYHQQAFNEAQDVLLTRNIDVDGGFFIPAGTRVNSHMIFFNTPYDDRVSVDLNVPWTFDGNILGVMSDEDGTLEAASNDLLGASGTIYGSFWNRGMEAWDLNNPDNYIISSDLRTITVDMYVFEPGDWIRVVTEAAPIPVPSTMLLLCSGLIGLLGIRTRFKS